MQLAFAAYLENVTCFIAATYQALLCAMDVAKTLAGYGKGVDPAYSSFVELQNDDLCTVLHLTTDIQLTAAASAHAGGVCSELSLCKDVRRTVRHDKP